MHNNNNYTEQRKQINTTTINESRNIKKVIVKKK